MSKLAKLLWRSSIAVLAVPGLLGQSENLPSFEVASVRPHGPTVFRPLTAETGPGRFVRGNVKVKDLVCWAYDLLGYQIAGGPDWFNSQELRSNRYDVEAKIDQAKIGGKVDLQQIKLMVQSLLADRFQLRVHREMRELPVYALVVAEKGPRLRTVKDAELGPGKELVALYGAISARSAGATDLARVLTVIADRPVLDQTGLDGKYDFELQFDQSSTGRGNQRPVDVGKPSIFTAVREQLGLRLDPQRAQMELLVVDHVEKPTDN
jgi:uncharacterized protein (TIGR03435 family)